MKQVLKGGIVVGGSDSFKADVFIGGRRVTAAGAGKKVGYLADKDTRVVDVEGCLLFSGFIDTHIHFDPHVAGIVTADDFATGTKTAVKDGITAIVGSGIQYTGESPTNGLRN